MTHHLNWLAFDDGHTVREVINGARTLAHLASSGLACGTVTLYDNECAVLSLDPCDYVPLTFTTPDDPDNPAPWYDGTPGSPSSNGYGFIIEEWTGLDGAHMKRSANGVYPRGAVFGPLGQAHRVWKMNVVLYGADPVALEDLFRWLEESLIQCCSPGVTAWVRTTCPDGYDEDYGLVHVVDLQMLEGVEWIEPPIEALGRFARRVSFTLGVGDPCLYRPPVNCYTDEPFPTGSIAALSAGTDEVATSQATNLGAADAIEVFWRGDAADWSPASAQVLVSHAAASPNFGWIFSVLTTSELRFQYSLDGTTYGTADSGEAVFASPFDFRPISLKVQRNGPTGDVKFYTSDDEGATWTQLGLTVLGAGGDAFTPTTPITIGGAPGANNFIGTVNQVAIHSGTGVLLAMFNPDDGEGSSSWTDPRTGHTWTVGSPGVTLPTESAVDLSGLGLSRILGCPVDPDAFAPWRLCCTVAGERLGTTAPVVIVQNNSTTNYSSPFRVLGVTDNGSGCMVANNEIFGEVRVSGFPPQSELMIDCARRRVLWRPLGFLRPWEPGYVYLDTSAVFVPDYPAVGCNEGMIFIEPTTVTSSLDDLTVTVDMVGRYGCC